MSPPFHRIAILGLGLMGGCIALESKKRRLARKIVAYNRSASRRQWAKKKGWCQEVYADPRKAVLGADLVVLATPVKKIPRLAETIAGDLQAGALVTDVGSTKGMIVKELDRILPRDVQFVGGHPIAGREKTGIESAIPGLFEDRWWIFTPGPRRPGSGKALTRLRRWAQDMGAKTTTMTPAEHDQCLALISHLPHMVAYALVDSALKVKGGKNLRFAAGGFRDFTRIAGSSPQMWAEICLDNQKFLLQMMERYEKSLGRIRQLIKRGDEKALTQLFAKAAQARKQL
ncbi:MAG: prephenate dehydrogenase/arogenate dehydrogenase family protein [bacterium]|nr:prephenate dehydrogenase/arogenate dehydrogenase family protein [bacterium]